MLRLIYSLALQLGYASPSRMLAEMRPSELGMWEALWAIDPWGPQRADVGHAMVAATVAAGLLKRPGNGRFKLSDFMAYYEAPPADPEALSERIRAAFGVIETRRAG